ncbi:unnamed protein product [Lampetra fluviatilis]
MLLLIMLMMLIMIVMVLVLTPVMLMVLLVMLETMPLVAVKQQQQSSTQRAPTDATVYSTLLHTLQRRFHCFIAKSQLTPPPRHVDSHQRWLTQQ